MLPVLLYVVFLVIAFRNESTFRPQVSAGIWVPLIWMIICGSRSLTRWLDISTTPGLDYDAANLEGSQIDRVFLSTLILFALVILSRRRTRLMSLLGRNKALLLFFLYLGLSTLWSDVVAVSIRRWFSLAGGFIMAATIMTEPEPLEALKVSLRRCAYILIPASVLYVKFFPEFGVQYNWDGQKTWAGVALEKNGLGHLCVVSTLFIVWSIIIERERVRSARDRARLLMDVAVVVMALWLLKGPEKAYSATSVAALVVGIGLCLIFRLRSVRQHIRNVATFILCAVVGLFLLHVTVNPIGMLVEFLGRDMTFTGRTPLWSTLIDLGLQRPLFGYGYGGFWIPERIELIRDRVNLIFRIGHNGFLEIFIEGGFVGVLLLLTVLVTSVMKIQRTLVGNFSYGVLRLCLLTAIVICNLTESSIARSQNFLWFVFLLVAVSEGVGAVRRGRGGYDAANVLTATAS